ncbi:MAG: alpha/beta hydrolase [Candidatus Pacearchaeota archaeon]|nr:alpha/beta hydrolase [Candidatus Pacearchaeota archaeon]MDE1848686.1 alpha/beta hydrolase [Nanoarchaeota archaeon]
MTIINSSEYKNLFFAYALSEEVPSRGTIILLDGLPSNPLSKNQLMKKLSEQDYDIFFPRYEGTWESGGRFLERAPSEAIIEFIEMLKRGRNLENKKYKAGKVFLLGSSFGGGVALDIATKFPPNKICVVSPVISFRKVEGIESLGNHLKTSEVENYRFDSRDWQRLIEDKIWNLENCKIINPSNIMIIAGKDDDQIKEKDVTEFGKKNSIKVRVCDSGHITLSKIPDSILAEIIDFFSE